MSHDQDAVPLCHCHPLPAQATRSMRQSVDSLDALPTGPKLSRLLARLLRSNSRWLQGKTLERAMSDVIPLVMDGSWQHVPDSAPLADGCSSAPNPSLIVGPIYPCQRWNTLRSTAISIRGRGRSGLGLAGRRRIGEGRSSGWVWMMQPPSGPPLSPPSGSVVASSLVGGRFWSCTLHVASHASPVGRGGGAGAKHPKKEERGPLGETALSCPSLGLHPRTLAPSHCFRSLKPEACIRPRPVCRLQTLDSLRGAWDEGTGARWSRGLAGPSRIPELVALRACRLVVTAGEPPDIPYKEADGRIATGPIRAPGATVFREWSGREKEKEREESSTL